MVAAPWRCHHLLYGNSSNLQGARQCQGYDFQDILVMSLSKEKVFITVF
jgi:hypothetical protein